MLDPVLGEEAIADEHHEALVATGRRSLKRSKSSASAKSSGNKSAKADGDDDDVALTDLSSPRKANRAKKTK